MLDFTNCKKLVNSYEGADIKLKVELDGDIYVEVRSEVGTE